MPDAAASQRIGTPDGRSLVFVGRVGEVKRLYMRRLDEDEARPLDGTEGAAAFTVSPDGLYIGRAAREIRRSTDLELGPRPESPAFDEHGRRRTALA